MGLFRSRSTGLLRLGGALRDCCCRPQSPPPSYACGCPSFVSKCGGDTENFDHVVSLPYYGYTHDLCLGTPTVDYQDSNFSGGGFSFFRAELGRFSRDADVRGVGVAGEVEKSWYDGAGEGAGLYTFIQFFCNVSPEYVHCFRFRARLDFGWQKIVPLSNSSYKLYETSFTGLHDVPVVFKCQPNDARDFKTECCRDRLPLPAFLSFVAGRTGISVNGVITPWAALYEEKKCQLISVVGGVAVSEDIPCIEPPWGEPDYRDSFELTLATQSECDECDCELNLSGRTVVFEGQSFSYGQGEDFSNGLVFLAEESPGFFKKIVYDDCNPDEQLKVSEKTASVYCVNVDGEDKWAALLVSICYERDACDLVSERARTTTWDGLFNCGADGIPGGAPETTLSSDIIGTTGECNSALPPLPSIVLS